MSEEEIPLKGYTPEELRERIFHDLPGDRLLDALLLTSEGRTALMWAFKKMAMDDVAAAAKAAERAEPSAHAQLSILHTALFWMSRLIQFRKRLNGSENFDPTVLHDLWDELQIVVTWEKGGGEVAENLAALWEEA